MLESDLPDVKTLIPEFADDARIYRSFSSQPKGSRRAHFFERMEMLNTSTPFPLVLLLFKRAPTVLSDGDVDRCLATIEAYLVRRMLWRGTAQGYNRLFTELGKEVRGDPSHAPEIIQGQLARAEGASRLWPRDSELLAVLTQSRAYGSGAIARHRLLDVLWEVERRLRSDKHEKLERPRHLQIEHIMPKSWSKHWPISPDGDATLDQRRAERDVAVNRLGNLTLVTDKLNPSMSHAGWDVKRQALEKHSLLAMNQVLVHEYGNGFDETSIDQRGEQLAHHILALWRGPTDDMSSHV
jgi:hypothetical protein